MASAVAPATAAARAARAARADTGAMGAVTLGTATLDRRIFRPRAGGIGHTASQPCACTCTAHRRGRCHQRRLPRMACSSPGARSRRASTMRSYPRSGADGRTVAATAATAIAAATAEPAAKAEGRKGIPTRPEDEKRSVRSALGGTWRSSVRCACSTRRSRHGSRPSSWPCSSIAAARDRRASRRPKGPRSPCCDVGLAAVGRAVRLARRTRTARR